MEKMESKTNYWVSITECPSNGIHESLIKVSNKEFISIASKSIDKYDITNDTWTKLIDLPESLIGFRCTVSLDNKANILYIYGTAGKLSTFNLNTNQLNVVSDITHKIGLGAASLIFDDKFHILGGLENSSHLIYNTDTKQFDEIENLELLTGQKIVCLPKKQIWLLIGGWEPFGDTVNTIYKCDIKKSQSYKWTRLDLTLPLNLNSFGIVKVMNGRYVIIFGGDDRSGMMSSSYRTIFVLDTQMMKFFRVKNILCPDCGRLNAVVMNDDIELCRKVVSAFVGWVMRLYSKEFEKITLSDDILGLIQKFFVSEWVYLCQGRDTWKINVYDIINNAIEECGH